jgi:DNA-binding response OmpR family regulator
MVTAKAGLKDKRLGFLAGTDDYMTKPVDEQEMVLRIKALLRRAQIASERRLFVSDIVLNYDALTVSSPGEMIQLPQKEFRLLFHLLSYTGTIFTRIQLMDEIWGVDSEADDRTVCEHIYRLRDRFHEWPQFEIITVRGLGYKAVMKA